MTFSIKRILNDHIEGDPVYHFTHDTTMSPRFYKIFK